MKLIYSETIRKDYRSPYREVRAYYPEYPAEPYDLPALLCLEIGRYTYGGDVNDLVQWSMIVPASGNSLTQSLVIRRAQEILAGGSFEELACNYCRELGWNEPK